MVIIGYSALAKIQQCRKSGSWVIFFLFSSENIYEIFHLKSETVLTLLTFG
jgi:hypothetical protein